ncbi:hypothetical protein [Acidovorax soli]|uniref:hypothetical protein n=1 Tax=Acidovorax soli TaxID=592050 RepID=UPI0032B1EA57
MAIPVVSLGVAGLAACDVKKTQAGNVTLLQHGVKTPDASVATEQKTATVPTIKAKEKAIDRPRVEITPASRPWQAIPQGWQRRGIITG